MLEFIVQKTAEAAINLTKDWLKEKIEQKNNISIEKKKENRQLRTKIEPRLDGARKRGSALFEIRSKKPPQSDDDTDNSENIELRIDEEAKADIGFSVEEVSVLLTAHLRDIEHWCSTVSFSDLRGSRKTSRIYVELDTFLIPSRLHMDQAEKDKTVPLMEAISSSEHHHIILGSPGAGKTTAMKKFCLTLLDKNSTKKKLPYNFPILLRFKDLPTSDGVGINIRNSIAQIFGFSIRIGGVLLSPDEAHVVAELQLLGFIRFLDSLGIAIVLDGFDELPNQKTKDDVIVEIADLTSKLKKTRIVMTCRTGEFNHHVDKTIIYEISPLSIVQIEEFATKWLADKKEASDFLDQIYRSPYADTAIKPLLLAHLCALYERIGRVPDKPKTVYRKIVSLLLEDWDEQRSVRRLSRYAGFEADRKLEFLSNMAYFLTTQSRKLVFTTSDFVQCYHQLCSHFNLDRSQANLVAMEIESHTGLFLQSGYDRFEFAHKSTQEYLTAEYIVRLPSFPTDRSIIQNLGGEIAIAVAISSNSTEYLTYLGLEALPSARLERSFWDAFIHRLITEKPDLYDNEGAVLAVFNILSCWISSGGDYQHYATYGNLLSLHRSDDVSRVVRRHYQIDGPNSTNDRAVLVRKPGRRGAKLGEGGYAIPAKIFAPAQFILTYLT